MYRTNFLECHKRYQYYCLNVFDYLLNKAGLENSVGNETESIIEDIGNAVITISDIFKMDYERTFFYLKESSQYIELFEEYCMVIPTKHDSYFFYNFLRRISLIFELGVYCHHLFKDESYLDAAFRCLSNYNDIKYFYEVGGWESLQPTVAFFLKIRSPLKLMLTEDLLQYENICTFYDALEKLLECDRLEDNPDAFGFLKELSEWFIMGTGKTIQEELSRLHYYASDRKTAFSFFEACAVSAREYLTYPKEAGISLKDIPSCSWMSKPMPAGMVDGFSSNSVNMPRNAENFNPSDAENFNPSNAENFNPSNAEHFNPSYTGNNVFLKIKTEISVPKRQEERNQIMECVHDSHKKGSVLSVKVPNGQTNFYIKQRVKLANGSENARVNNSSHPEIANITFKSNLTFNKNDKNYSEFEKSNLSPEDSFTEDSDFDEVSNDRDIDFSLSMELKMKPRANRTKISSEKKHASSSKCHLDNTKNYVDSSDSENLEKDIKFSKHPTTATGKIDPNFIIPMRYMSLRSESKCKRLYSLNLYFPQSKEKISQRIKEILDAKLENKDYSLMFNYDTFVQLAQSSTHEEEIRFVLADDSSDEESDEYMEEMLCLFKRSDFEFEKKTKICKLKQTREFQKGERYMKKKIFHTLSRTEKKKLKSFCKSYVQKFNQCPNYRATIEDLYQKSHVRYLIKLYKETLPIIFPLISPDLKTCSTIKDGSCIVYFVTEELLEQARIDLESEKLCEVKQGLWYTESYSDYSLHDVTSQALFYSYIEQGTYERLFPGVYVVGIPLHEIETWFLFDVDSKKNSDETEYNTLKTALLYMKALSNYGNSRFELYRFLVNFISYQDVEQSEDQI